MKTNYWIILIAIFIGMVSCDDSDDAGDANKYSKIYGDQTLKLDFNGERLTDKSVKFITQDLLTADITLERMIPGENHFNFPNVSLTQSSTSNNIYVFSASDTNENRSVTLQGQVGDGVMEATVTFTVSTPLKGKWTLAPNTPFQIYAIPQSPNETFNMYGIWIGKDKPPIPLTGSSDSFTELIKNLGGIVFSLIINLDIELAEDGNLVAGWSSPAGLINPGQSENGVVKYNVVGDKVYALLALDKIIANLIPTRVEIGDITALFANGIALNLTYTGDNSIQISVDKEMMTPFLDIALLILKPILGSANYPEVLGALGITAESMPLFADEFVRVINACEEFELQFNLIRKD